MRQCRPPAILLAISLTAAVAWASGSALRAEIASARAKAPADCDAPKAVFRRGAIRVFIRGQTIRTYYLCSESLRKPRAYNSRRIDEAEDDPFDFSVKGQRLMYTDFIVKTQIEVLAWVDLRTARYRQVKVPRGRDYDEIRALGADGGIAFVTTDHREGQRIWYAAPGRNALGRPRVLARIPDGDIVPGTLSISRGMVRWKTAVGPPRSAPLAGRARTVSSASRTCRSRERIYRDGAIWIFMRRVGNIERFYLCSMRLRKPKLFLEKDPWTYPPLYGFKRFGHYLRFSVDWGGESDERGLGWVDLRSARQKDVTVPAELELDESVVGPDGAIAVRANREIHYARPGRRSLNSLRLLVTITEGEPARRSLAIRDGKVTWKTKTGQPGSVPVPRAG